MYCVYVYVYLQTLEISCEAFDCCGSSFSNGQSGKVAGVIAGKLTVLSMLKESILILDTGPSVPFDLVLVDPVDVDQPEPLIDNFHLASVLAFAATVTGISAVLDLLL